VKETSAKINRKTARHQNINGKSKIKKKWHRVNKNRHRKLAQQQAAEIKINLGAAKTSGVT